MTKTKKAALEVSSRKQTFGKWKYVHISFLEGLVDFARSSVDAVVVTPRTGTVFENNKKSPYLFLPANA